MTDKVFSGNQEHHSRQGNPPHRWVVLCTDGRHVTLGRHREPSSSDIGLAAKQLKELGLGGWLVSLEGNYWVPSQCLRAEMIEPLASPSGRFEDTLAAFEKIRHKRLSGESKSDHAV